MMKTQDVLLKAMAKKISWLSAAEIIGVTPRTMRRWRARLAEHGYDGLRDRRRGKPSQKRVPLATCEQVLELYQTRYYDFNVKHFHEKLNEEHGIQLSYTWVNRALQGAGLAALAAPMQPDIEARRLGRIVALPNNHFIGLHRSVECRIHSIAFSGRGLTPTVTTQSAGRWHALGLDRGPRGDSEYRRGPRCRPG